MDEFGVLVRHFEANEWGAIQKAFDESAPFVKVKGVLARDLEALSSEQFGSFQADFQKSIDEVAAAKNVASIAGFLKALSAQISQPINMAVKLETFLREPERVSRPWKEYQEALENLQKQTKDLRDQFKNKVTKLVENSLAEKPASLLRFENE